MFQTILVGVDGSDAAKHALEKAVELARLMGGSVHVISVEERLPAYAATVSEVDEEDSYANAYYARVQSEALRTADAKGVPLTHEVLPGHAADVLVRAAKAGGVDLLVIGHTGHSRLHNMFLGSTADRVVEHAPCPVLVVR
jgi:nucleotide-binding universal stress UspA family protein